MAPAGFRGGDAAAQLKLRPPGVRRDHEVRGFRGGDAAAQLKHISLTLEPRKHRRIPRRRRRGSIEAWRSSTGGTTPPGRIPRRLN